MAPLAPSQHCPCLSAVPPLLWQQLFFCMGHRNILGQENGIWGQFLGVSAVIISKLMLEDNAVYLGNICCAGINSGVLLWQQRAPNPAPEAQNPGEYVRESRCFELWESITRSTTRLVGSGAKTLKFLSKFCLFLNNEFWEPFTGFEITNLLSPPFEPVNSWPWPLHRSVIHALAYPCPQVII